MMASPRERLRRALIFICILCAVIVTNSWSADPEPVTFRPISPGELWGASRLSLMQSMAVQEELGLTDGQVEKQTLLAREHEAKLSAARETADRKAFRAAWEILRVAPFRGTSHTLRASTAADLENCIAPHG